MEKFYIEAFKAGKLAVNCRTQEEADKFCDMMADDYGLCWHFDRSYSYAKRLWLFHSEDTCYCYKDIVGGYGSSKYFGSKGYEVRTFSELFADDQVKAPSHYTKGGIETIDYIRAKLTPEEFVGYCKGNVIKYVSREADKGGKQDFEKAAEYIAYAIDGYCE